MAGIELMRTRWKSNMRYVTAAPQLRRILSRVSPDLLLTLYSGGSAQLARLSGFHPWMAWVVGSEVLIEDGPGRRLLSAALTRADLVLSNGDVLAEQTRRLAPGARVETLLLGVDLAELPLRPKARGPVRILTNRGFSAIYQNDLIVRALASLDPAVVGDYRAVFASSGPDLAATRELAQRILPPAVRERVEFLGGVTRRQMLDLLADSHVFISMAKSEGTATSLLEAMASGLYPVVADIPQNREWLDGSPESGTLVPVSDHAMLAAALRSAVARGGAPHGGLAANRALVEARADSHRTLQRIAGLAASLNAPGRSR
jgi:glycosyltransferase involved in cell wall biosynthesis